MRAAFAATPLANSTAVGGCEGFALGHDLILVAPTSKDLEGVSHLSLENLARRAALLRGEGEGLVERPASRCSEKVRNGEVFTR